MTIIINWRLPLAAQVPAGYVLLVDWENRMAIARPR